ncbi:hypothetical protein DFJ74DRAFT_768896 [Hyaloraphidium curvatum]|nr:hypothetical protein DFJ74DRAFT_768896 [Hyaloraphidium curvatum]
MPKTIFVLGGTGLAGSIAIDLFLSRSHTVVAYSRNASKFRPDLATTHPSTFFPIAGTLESEEDICAAMGSRKVDAVVSFLGPKTGVRRIFALGTTSYADVADGFSLLNSISVGLISLIAPAGKAEFVAIGKLFNEDEAFRDLDWTLFRVGWLSNGSATAVNAGPVGGSSSASGIRRASIAAWLADQIEMESTDWVKRLPYISSQ